MPRVIVLTAGIAFVAASSVVMGAAGGPAWAVTGGAVALAVVATVGQQSALREERRLGGSVLEGLRRAGADLEAQPQPAAALRALLDARDEERDALRTEVALRDRPLSSMREAVVVIRDGKAVYANDAATPLLGLRMGSLVPPAFERSARAASGEFEVEMHHPTRRVLRCVPAHYDGGTVLVARDVTEQKRVEAMRRDLVADASHELKTPASAILATAETLAHALEADPQSAPRFASMLVAEARRLSRLVQTLLDLARVERAEVANEVVSLVDVVAHAVEQERERAAAQRIALTTTMGASGKVRGQPDDVLLMVRNILDNALRYTNPGGTVTVEVSESDDRVRMQVSDTGIGIPAKELPRIFERFYRVDKARARETGGTGLGLAIVRHVVEQLGGSVEVESELGRGSTFIVLLPRAA